jgi:hypothetical protein
MLEIDAGQLIGAVGFLNTTCQFFQIMDRDNQTPILIQSDVDNIRKASLDVASMGHALNLSMTSAVAKELLAHLDELTQNANGTYDINKGLFFRLISSLTRLQSAKYEAHAKVFLGLDTSNAALWNDTQPFGADVFAAFPSAQLDISEASKCLAVNRGTACVMHLMRAIEVALKALASNLRIGRQNDWGSYIREIEKHLSESLKTSGKHSSEEEFFALATVSFDVVKRAWRNKTMHVEKTYNPQHAKEIFEATRIFIVHLSSKIRE